MKKKQKNEIKSRMEKFAETLEMPKDLLSNCSKITSYNDNQVIVENYKGILEYTENKIRIKTPGRVLCLNGEKLSINSITECDVLIEGKFYNMGWE